MSICSPLNVGCKSLQGVSTVNDEGKTYFDKEWHTFEARRFGIEGSVRIDAEWRGDKYCETM